MRRGALETALGALVAVLLLLVFALALRNVNEDDLVVRVEGPRTHLLFASDPASRVDVGPRSLRSRVRMTSPEGVSSTELFTYRLVYGHRWEREVTVPSVLGSVSPEGTPWPCAVKLRLLPSFFDDKKPGGGDAVEIIDRQIRAQFPRDVVVGGVHVMRFAAVRSTEMSVTFDDGLVGVIGKATLDDDGTSPTEFRFRGAVRLAESDGDLTVTLEKLDLDWSGKTRRSLLVRIADIVTDPEAIAQKIVREEIGKVLPFIRLPREALRLEDLVQAGPDIDIQGALRLRLCGAPKVGPDGVTIEAGATVQLDGRRKDPGIAGPPRLRGRPAELRFPKAELARGEAAFNMEAIASAEALQQTLYILWQSRALERWGRSAEALDAFRASLQDRLTLELGELDPRLPPAYVAAQPGCDGFSVRFADVVLGHVADGRTAVAHADVCSSPRIRKGRIELEGRLVYVAANCQRWDGGLKLTPCLSDVIPIVREQDLSKYAMPLSLPIPERLMRVSLIRDASLELEDLHADMQGEVLHIKARGVLSPR